LPLIIDYYTDILCVWAWIAQRRIDELSSEFSEQIELRFHYVDIFGDVPSKMATQWHSKGGYEGFAEHVRHSATEFDEVVIHPQLWHKVRPDTSANAHLALKAVELACDATTAIAMALTLRTEFFAKGADIGKLDVLSDIFAAQGLDVNSINTLINNGGAMAALMGDYRKAQQQGIKGSPSYVLDGGRQTLYGNVGYRVLQANVEELLKHPAEEASWC
jgi:predicted DsbA family dithiol-disulfide isomerase